MTKEPKYYIKSILKTIKIGWHIKRKELQAYVSRRLRRKLTEEEIRLICSDIANELAISIKITIDNWIKELKNVEKFEIRKNKCLNRKK